MPGRTRAQCVVLPLIKLCPPFGFFHIAEEYDTLPGKHVQRGGAGRCTSVDLPDHSRNATLRFECTAARCYALMNARRWVSFVRTSSKTGDDGHTLFIV